MALTFPPVQSGDIIASSLMNQILQALSSLDTRVSKLEGATTGATGAPHIQSISPLSGVHVGDLLTVTGTNLWAAGMNVAFIDLNGTLTRVTQFTTQSDSQLVFNIPPVFVQGGGSSVFLRVVSPTQGSDSVQFTLLPAAVTIPHGQVQIQLAAPPNTVFNAPGSGVTNYILSYTIAANTDLGDTYDLNPTISAAGWSTAIVDGGGAVIPNATLYIEAAPSLSQPTIKRGSLQLSIPAGATGSAKLVLTVVSHLNPGGLTVPSPTAIIPVGGSVLLSNGIGVMPQPRPSDVDSSGNLLVPITSLPLRFQITVAATGQYNLSYRFDNDAAHWTASVPSSITIGTANLPTPISTTITPNPGAQASNFYLKVALQGDTTGNVITEVFYPVVLKS
jgi:hypothetical protein